MKNNIVNTVAQFLFLFIGFIFIMLVSLGIKFDLHNMFRVSFWVEVTAKLIVALFFFNLVFNMTQRNSIKDTNSLYYRTLITNKVRVSKIQSDKELYKKLEEEVKKVNKQELEKLYNDKIHDLTTRLNFEDLSSLETKNFDEQLRELFEEFLITNKKVKKKTTKLIKKILSGRVKICDLSAEELLIDTDHRKIETTSLRCDERSLTFKRNYKKAMTFLITSIAITTITFSLFMPNFWTALVSNLSLMLGSVVSAITSAISYIKTKTVIYETRNNFFKRSLNVDDDITT